MKPENKFNSITILERTAKSIKRKAEKFEKEMNKYLDLYREYEKKYNNESLKLQNLYADINILKKQLKQENETRN